VDGGLLPRCARSLSKFRADGGIHNIDERIVWVEEFWIYGG
jgi:hypothetical protein